MKKIIVSTTIQGPTEAIEKFDAMEDWELIVIGDKKTPKNYTLKRGEYVSPEKQEEYDKVFSDALGWNCIQRRNMGFLMAYDRGAEIIATVDDDNSPYDFWGQDLMLGKSAKVRMFYSELPVFDPIGATEYKNLWHRGYPLELLSQRKYNQVQEGIEIENIDVQADFWDGDPDVDAICRMEHRPECAFDPKSFPLATNTWAPFNSQNTFLTRESIKNYFMFPHVGRMDDIWGAYFLEAKGASVVFNKASAD